MKEKVLIQNHKSNRVEWITGLKGLACFAVFVHHSVLTLMPEAFTGEERWSVSWLLSSSPVGVLINGNFCVFLFMTLSTFLTANSVLKSTSDNFRSKVGTICIKRYFRLMLPILAYGCIRYLLIHIFSSVGRPLPVGQYESFWFVIRHAMYDTFVSIDSSITGPLWMMSLLFKDTYLVLLLTLPDRKSMGKWLVLLYIFVFSFIGLSSERWRYYYMAAVMGTLAVDLMPYLERLVEKKYMTVVPKILILAGLFLGGVPTPSVPDLMACYRFVTVYPDQPELCHCIGAFLLLVGLLGEHFIFQKQPHRKMLISFLQIKPIQYLGKISFSVFLTHEVLLAIFMLRIADFFTVKAAFSRGLVVCATLFVLSVIVILVSAAFYHGVEKQMDKICGRIRV